MRQDLMRYCGLMTALLLFLNINNIQAQNFCGYIDPTIGSEGHGNVFIGPSCPFGMVKPGPDNNKDMNSGFDPDTAKAIYGFSQVHVSGTGGGPKYGNISIMPFAKQFKQIEQTSLWTEDQAKAGYYAVTLRNGNIRVEITTSPKVAFYRYQFRDQGPKGLKIDLGKFLGEEATPDAREAQQFVGSEVELVSESEIRGYSRIRGGWNNGTAYTVYFYAIVDKTASSYGTWKADNLYPGVGSQSDSGEKTGIWLQFDKKPTTIQVKIGISFVSTLKAKENIQTEMPHWNFNQVLAETRARWDSLIDRIDIGKSAPKEQLIQFYTAMYHSLLMPVDRAGENPLWTAAPYYDDFYAIWDTYRTTSPLITLISPEREAGIVNAMLNIFRYDGYLPDARSGNCNGRTQGGSNAEVVIADAYVKGLPGIDYKLALKAMLKDATVPPGGNEEKEGRGGLTDYNTLGYVSDNFVRAGNRTLEYAYDDYCLAQVAKGLGFMTEYRRFMSQADNWQNLWREVEDHGSTGFIMPRDATGNWIDSIHCDGATSRQHDIQYTPLAKDWPVCLCWWCGFFYEGNSWEYSFFVPHDVRTLIQKCGGKEAFLKRLDTFFNLGFYQVGNEPSFLTPCLYHWIGRPDLSSQCVQRIVNRYFNATRNGIPGNDDSGAMSSWLAFHMTGIYPVAGQSYYLIHSPMVEQTIFRFENGKEFRITAHSFSPGHPYVRTAMLNGKIVKQAWIEHSDIISGGELVLEMDSSPSDWGSEQLPPSKEAF